MHALKTAALGLSLLTAGCTSEPAVQIEAWVGPRHAKDDLQRREAEAQKVAQTALAELLPEPPASDPEAEAARFAAHPPTTPAELEGLVTALRKGPLADVAGPAHRIAAADPSLWPEIKTRLLAERRAPKGDYRSLLKAIGGDVPNRYGHFNLAWKKAHGHRVTLSTDWFSDLLVLPRSKISPVLRKVYRDCVLQTALLRAAAVAGREPARTGEVIETLLAVAYHHQGTWRDEVGRAVQAVGDEAVAHLIRAGVGPAGRQRDDDPAVQRARYALVQLDRMDRLHPQRAIDAVRADPRRLTAVLAAFGDAKVGEAAGPLLDYVDATDPAVRAAAREAILAYVSGPPPKGRSRTIRLLGGETSKARAYLTYRQRAAIAIQQRLTERAPALREPDCGPPPPHLEDKRTARQKADCQQQPLRHVVAYLRALDEQRDEARQARIEAALAQPSVVARVQALDELLASEPTLPEAAQLVAEYRDAALDAMDEGSTVKAAQLLRKSAMLIEGEDAGAARRFRVTALLAEASTPGLSDAGRTMLLSTAQELAPDDPQVSAAHAAASGRQRQRARVGAWPWSTLLIGALGGALGIALIGALFRPLRRRWLAEDRG